MDRDQIINHLMPTYSINSQQHHPQSISEAKSIVDNHLEISCLCISQHNNKYIFKEILCADKTCIERSTNVFDSIKNIIRKFDIPVNGQKFIFHFKGDACNLEATRFTLLSNARNIGNKSIILWPLLMKYDYFFRLTKYNPILHDEISKYVKNSDTNKWDEKISNFIFRGTNSGNPFSSIQYSWDEKRSSRCDLLLEYLNLPIKLKSIVDIGFNELYPRKKLLSSKVNDIEYLENKFSRLLKKGKDITDLQNEIKIVLDNVKPSIKKSALYKYKFIICPEGFDCSSSLFWVLASNSVAIVPPFHYENIIVNQQYLKPYVHFLPIEENYSNLSEVIHWSINNDNECQQIAINSHHYMKPFLDEETMLFIQKKIIRRLLTA